MTSALPEKIAAVNGAHTFANALYPPMRRWALARVGLKIINADGTMSKAAKGSLPSMQSRSIRWHIPSSAYSIGVEVEKTQVTKGESVIIQKAYFNIGSLQDGVLTRVSELETLGLKDDYTQEEVETAYAEIDALQEKKSEIEGKISPFVRY